MIRLKALKPLAYPRGRYNTRRLVPGDIFEVPDNKAGRLEAKVFRARRVAEELREPVAVPAPPPAVAEKIKAAVAPVTPATQPAPAAVGAMTTVQAPNASPPATDDRAALRAEYEKALGKVPFLGWSADVLREKIATAKAAS